MTYITVYFRIGWTKKTYRNKCRHNKCVCVYMWCVRFSMTIAMIIRSKTPISYNTIMSYKLTLLFSFYVLLECKKKKKKLAILTYLFVPYDSNEYIIFIIIIITFFFFYSFYAHTGLTFYVT